MTREQAIDARYRALECRTAVKAEYDTRPVDGLRLERGGFTLVFDREPALVLDKAGEPIGVDAWLRLYDAKGVEVPIDPHRVILNPPLHPRSDVTETVARDGTRTRKIAPVSEQGKREAFYESLWDSVLGQPHAEGWERAWRTGRGTVTTVFATAPGGDATVVSLSATYSTARTSGDVLLDGTADIQVGQDNDAFGFFGCFEGFAIFNTSGLPDGDDVTGVVLSLFGANDDAATDFTAIAASDDYDGGQATAADWVSGADLAAKTTYATFDSTGFVDEAHNAFTSAGAAFNSAINKTGNTAMIIYSSRHSAGNSPTSAESLAFRDADSTGTTGDPKLDITHGSAGASGSGAVTAGAATASGTGTQTITGSGAATAGAATASGTGAQPFTGSGAATAGAATASGSGTMPISGSGAATAGAATASGTGEYTPTVVEGSGAPTAGAATASGSGTLAISGSGAATAGAATASGTGTQTFTGSGAATAGAATASGTGTQSFVGSGAATAGAATASGTGHMVPSGSGAATAGAATASGTGSQAISGSGAATAGAATASGDGTQTNTGTGAATAGAATSSGSGTQTITGSGSPTAGAATASGTGTHTGAPAGFGGESGEYRRGLVDITGQTSITVTVGAGGTGDTGETNTGSKSSFGSFIIALGGGMETDDETGGDIVIPQSPGGEPDVLTGQLSLAGDGGTSPFGGEGKGAKASGGAKDGGDATGYGSGGGGAATVSAGTGDGGDGKQGIVIIRWWE